MRRFLFFLFLAVFLLCAIRTADAVEVVPGPRKPQEPVSKQTKDLIIEVMGDEKLRAEINDRNLSDVLRAMADKNLFDINGDLPSGETVSMSISDVTLADALKKLMRGYNYVLLDRGRSRKPLLTVMGKVERAKATEQKAQTVISLPPGAPASETERFYVPPSAPVEPPAKTSPQPARPSVRPAGADTRPGTSAAGQAATVGQDSGDNAPAAEGGDAKEMPVTENSPVDDMARPVKGSPQPGVTGPGSGQAGP